MPLHLFYPTFFYFYLVFPLQYLLFFIFSEAYSNSLLNTHINFCFPRMNNNIVGMETNMEQLLEKVWDIFLNGCTQNMQFYLAVYLEYHLCTNSCRYCQYNLEVMELILLFLKKESTLRNCIEHETFFVKFRY